MNRSGIWRKLPVLALLAAASLMLTAGASYAQATQGKIDFEDSFSETLTDFPCFEGAPVWMTGTVAVKGHFVDVADRHRSFHVTETIEYRVDIGDGRYLTGGVVNHFTVTVNVQRPRTTATSTQQERATLYSADGEPIGEMILHVTSHKTYSDQDGDGLPDPEEITVAVDRIKVRCP